MLGSQPADVRLRSDAGLRLHLEQAQETSPLHVDRGETAGQRRRLLGLVAPTAGDKGRVRVLPSQRRPKADVSLKDGRQCTGRRPQLPARLL